MKDFEFSYIVRKMIDDATNFQKSDLIVQMGMDKDFDVKETEMVNDLARKFMDEKNWEILPARERAKVAVFLARYIPSGVLDMLTILLEERNKPTKKI